MTRTGALIQLFAQSVSGTANNGRIDGAQDTEYFSGLFANSGLNPLLVQFARWDQMEDVGPKLTLPSGKGIRMHNFPLRQIIVSLPAGGSDTTYDFVAIGKIPEAELDETYVVAEATIETIIQSFASRAGSGFLTLLKPFGLSQESEKFRDPPQNFFSNAPASREAEAWTHT